MATPKMTPATRELGRSVLANPEVRLVAGTTSLVRINLVGQRVNEIRIPVNLTGLDITRINGPLPIDEQSVGYEVNISPDGDNPTTAITVHYGDPVSPDSTFELPVLLPLVTDLLPRQVETGRRKIVIHGHNLEGCRVEINGGIGRIISQKNHGNRIDCEVESEAIGICVLRLAFGQRQASRATRQRFADGNPIAVNFIPRPRRRGGARLWVTLIFLTLFIGLLGLNIL